MSPELRQTIVHARTREYSNIMRTTVFAFIGIAAVLHLGPDTFSIALVLLTATVTAFGVLAGGTALDDINNLKGDMTPEMAETTYGSGVARRDLVALKLISTIMIGLTGLALLLGILF
ncbi:MAG: hypothetical protein HKN27_00780 [Silicimonas sp.]|nr:hypothetical protein [Silicimonas sp.]